MERRALVADMEIAYEVVGRGPRLVWFHGLASCRDGDRDVIDALAERFTVLAYDARGHGRSSPVPEPDRHGYPMLAADAIAMLDELGWDRAVLAGSSMGGATAARVACVAPERATALIMVRPGAGGGDGRAPAWLQMLFAGGAHAIRTGGLEGAVAFLSSIPIAAEQLARDPARLEALRTDWGRHDPVSIAGALEGVPRTSPLDGGLTGAEVSCPALVIAGDDLIHPIEAAELVAALIPGARLDPPLGALPRADEVRTIVARIDAFLRQAGVLA